MGIILIWDTDLISEEYQIYGNAVKSRIIS